MPIRDMRLPAGFQYKYGGIMGERKNRKKI